LSSERLMTQFETAEKACSNNDFLYWRSRIFQNHVLFSSHSLFQVIIASFFRAALPF